MDSRTGKKPLHIILIIFAFLVNPILGIFLLIRRNNTDKSAAFNDGGLIQTLSYILIFIGVMFLTRVFTLVFFEFMLKADFLPINYWPAAGAFFISVLFIGGGIATNRIANKMKITGTRYKKYIDLIINQNMSSIDQIANGTGFAYESVVVDLQKMIEAGYFKNARIDEIQRVIHVERPPERLSELMPEQTPGQPPLKSGAAPAAASSSAAKIVTCGSCGANNIAYADRITRCEYCDSYLKYN